MLASSRGLQPPARAPQAKRRPLGRISSAQSLSLQARL